MRGKICIELHKQIHIHKMHTLGDTYIHLGNEFKKRYLYLHPNKRYVRSFRTSGWPFSMASMTLVLLLIVIEFTFVFIKSADIHLLTRVNLTTYNFCICFFFGCHYVHFHKFFNKRFQIFCDSHLSIQNVRLITSHGK